MPNLQIKHGIPSFITAAHHLLFPPLVALVAVVVEAFRLRVL